LAAFVDLWIRGESGSFAKTYRALARGRSVMVLLEAIVIVRNDNSCFAVLVTSLAEESLKSATDREESKDRSRVRAALIDLDYTNRQ
jgi:hypothetical protein